MFRSLLYSSLFILVLSCGNEPSPKQAIISKFDSVNKSIEAVNNTQSYMNPQLYDSLRRKIKDKNELAKLTQMRVTIQDFYTYINDLKKEFYTFCGNNEGIGMPAEREGEINLTNQFFIEQGYADYLFVQMKKVKESLPPRMTREEDMKSLIGTLEPGEKSKEPVDDFLNTYFKNVPPIGAVNILNAFETKIKNTETHTLGKYLNEYMSY
jgi:hypothetical protein